MMIEAEMYGMMPRREDREARQRAAREHVEHAEDAALLALEELGEHVRVDSGHRDVRADAEHEQRAEQEQQPPLQVAVAPGLCRRWEEASPSALRTPAAALASVLRARFLSLLRRLPPAR